jgi:hypothetical protein
MSRSVVERIKLPPMTAGATFHCDGMGSVSRSVRQKTSSEPIRAICMSPFLERRLPLRPQCQTAMGRHVRPSVSVGEMYVVPSFAAQATGWEREAAR